MRKRNKVRGLKREVEESTKDMSYTLILPILLSTYIIFYDCIRIYIAVADVGLLNESRGRARVILQSGIPCCLYTSNMKTSNYNIIASSPLGGRFHDLDSR